jgi:hypothetical protein
MFDEHFPPYCASTVMRWTPTWSKQTDPSGRYVIKPPVINYTLIMCQGNRNPRAEVRRHEMRFPNH